MNMGFRRLFAIVSFVGVFAVGCSESGPGSSRSADDPDALLPGDTVTPGAGEPPVYALVTQVFAPEGQTSYIALTDSIAKYATITLDSATEYPGRALGAGLTGAGTLYVGGNEGGKVTRYDLARDGRSLVEGPSLSFAGKGISNIGEYQEQFQFVSPTKAYYFDGRTAQMVVWDPSEMTVEGSVDLSQLVMQGALLTFSTNAIRRGNEIAFPLGWRSDVDARIVSEAAVLVVDTTNDSVRVVRDGRCGYVRTAVEGADGRLYLATEAYGSAVHRVVPAKAPAPCMLRLDAAWREFDPGYHVELSTLVGGATAGTLLPGPSKDSAWIRVLDESTTAVSDTTNPRVLASTAAWSWWTLSLTDSPTATPQPLGVSNGSDFLINTDDHAVVPEFAADRSHTVLRDLSTGSPGDSTVTIPGLLFSLVRLR